MFKKWILLPLIILLGGCAANSHYYQCSNYVPRLDTRIKAQTAEIKEMELQIIHSINSIRKEQGLNTLKQNERLVLIAREYSYNMASKNFFAHISPEGETLAERACAVGRPYKLVGENLFKTTNIKNPLSIVVKGWMESPGHRENIMRSQFTETGVGVWKKGNEYYFTQVFMKPLLD